MSSDPYFSEIVAVGMEKCLGEMAFGSCSMSKRSSQQTISMRDLAFCLLQANGLRMKAPINILQEKKRAYAEAVKLYLHP